MAAVVMRVRLALRYARSVVRETATDMTRIARLLWVFFASIIAGTFSIIGAGYVVGGQNASASKVLQLLANIEGAAYGLSDAAAYRVHGFVMLGLAGLMVYGFGAMTYRTVTRVSLMLMTLYSLVVAAMVFGGWFLYSVSFATAWWYVATAAFCTVLRIFAPKVLSGLDVTIQVEAEADRGGESA